MKIFSPVLKGTTTVSGGTTNLSGSFTGSLSGTSSYATNSDLLDGVHLSVLATTGSNQFNGNQTVTGSLTTTGTITAQTLVVQTVTSSVSYLTGSTQHGSVIGNTHQFTGSVGINPSLTVNNFFQSGSFPLNVNAYTEPYVIGTNSYKSAYVQSGTAVQLSSQISASAGTTAFLFDVNAYSGSAATNVYFGGVAGTTGNGPANFVIGRRTAVSTWAESLRIDTSGNVGIGTVSPQRTLHLNAASDTRLLITDSAVSTTVGTYIRQFGTSAAIVNSQNGTFQLGTNDSYFLTATGSNVGIGTITPSDKLNVVVGSNGNAMRLDGPTSGLIVQTNASSADIIAYGGTTASYRTLNFATSATTALTIASGSGNVGVYLTSPTQRLSIRGNQVFTNQDVDGITNALIAEISSQARGYANQGANMASIQFRTNPTTWYRGEIAFITNNSDGTNPASSIIESMRITSAGNVGIGTTTPTKLLEVNGRMSATAIVSGNIIVGNIASNIATSPSFILICDLNNAAGFSLSGKVNAASYTCWNISDVWIKKDYSATTSAAGITGAYKSGCDFSIVDINYNAGRYIALRFTGNPEIDVMFTGYRLHALFNSDGTAQVITGATVNSTLATY